MKLTQRLLVLLITVTMMLSGSFAQAFATEEAADGGSVVVSETPGSEDIEESKEDPKEEAKEEAKEEENAEEPKAEEAKEAAPEKEEPKAESESKASNESKAEPEKEATAKDDSKDAEELSAGTLTYECDEYTVTLDYGKKAEIPEGTKLEVREVLADSDSKKEQKEYKEYYDKSLEQLRNEKGGDSIAKLKFARFYDIALMSKGKEIEPSGDVSVKITFNEDARETVGEKDEAEKSLRIVRLTENEKTGKLEVASIDKKDTELSLDKKELSEASFTTDSFSVYGIVYTVDFESDNKQTGKTETVVEAKGKTFRMEAAYDNVAGIPAEGVRLYAKELKGDDPDVITFDIKIVSVEDENVVYQPAEGHNVALTVVVLDDKADTDEDTASVLHVCEDGTKETLTADLETTDEGYVYSFETESFSTFTFHRNGSSLERFITTVKTGRFGGSQTELSGSAEISNNNNMGWLSFEEVIDKWNPAYSNAGSNGRYSVIKANDSGGNTKQSLCAVGFFEGSISPVSLGRIATSGNVNGSATSYDLQIELNDNSLPVRITANGATAETIFVPSGSATSFTAESIAAELGYDTDGMMVTGKVNTVSADSVSRAKLTTTDIPTVSSGTWWTRLLAGETFDDFGAGSDLIVLNWVNYTATNVSYPAAYKWTYDNGGTQTVIGDTLYEIEMVPAVAQVSNDGGTTWKKFASLITGEYDGVTLEGAFNYANSLSGDVIVEMLYDTHERYTLSSGFNFNNSDITSLKIKGVGEETDTTQKTTLVKDQTTTSMITTTGIDTVEFNKIIFNGNGAMSVVGNGGAVKTDASSLNVSYCEFNNCQAGKANLTPGQGGGICHENTAGEASITNCVFNQCKANGKDDAAGGGGGFYTDAQKLTVTDCTFTACSTASRQGAGFFHRRLKTDPGNSETSVKDCNFKDCTSVWCGAGMESDAWDVTLDNCTFTNCAASKGGAFNNYADGQDSSGNNTSLNVKDCKFINCTGTDNGGAIRTTALHVNLTDSSFEGCSSNVNGGAVACTSNKTIAIITDCTFTDCHADNGNGGAIVSAGTNATATTLSGNTIEDCSAKNGGAVQSGNLLMSSGTIKNCTASAKGGAINCSQKIIMTGGTVTGCTTGGESAALDAATGGSGLTFSGDVKVEGNVGSSGEARDVYIGTDTDRHILIDSAGLGDNASIGVYVADANSAFDKHGKPGQMFAHTGSVQASTMNNLDKLFSDRLDNGEMHGTAAISGENYRYRIMWPGKPPVAPTGYTSKYLPFILILIGGVALVVLKKVTDRRRRSEDDTFETEE